MDINKLTADDFAVIKEAGGISGVVGADGILRTAEASQVFTPGTSTKISGYGTNIRPRIVGASHDPNTDGLIEKPNISKYNDEHEARLRADAARRAEAEKEREELQAFSDPKKLQAQLSAMDRLIRKLQREVKELKSNAS